MKDRSSELNPYASPSAEAPEVAEVKKRFRWRVIPVTILYVFGAPSLVASVAMLGMSVWWRFSRSDAVGSAPNGPMLVGMLCGVIASGLFLLTAFRLQRGRWWSAGLAFSVAVLLNHVFTRLSGFE